jgi:hypothetical protein
MRISCTKAQTFLACGIKYDLVYNKRYTTVIRPFALFYGSVLDHAVSAYVYNHALGKDYDIVTAFEKHFDEELAKYQIQYPQHWDADIARDAGITHCERFPEVWDKSNLIAVLDPQGIPVVQRRIIAPLPQNHELELRLDVLAMDTTNGDTAVLDWKTTSQPITPESPFGYNSFQLTTYQYGVDYEFSDYLGAVGALGFQEFVKRKPSKTGKGKGPTSEMPMFFPRRTDEQINDMLRTYTWTAESIMKKKFHRPVNGAFNSPCMTCDFARLCVHGDTQGITIRPARRAA